MRRSSGPRKTASLSEAIHHQLSMYSLAASAAGVSILAFTPPAEAKIVYTPANVVIGYGGVQSYNLDVNHDGIADFKIQTFEQEYGCGDRGWVVFRLFEGASSGNGVVGAPPAALNSGSKIGPGVKFHGGRGSMAFESVGFCSHHGRGGNWLNASDKYLGLAFRIHGRTYYGWARLSVTDPIRFHGFTATLTGYAYENIAGKSIIAGQTKGPADAASEESDPRDSLASPIPDIPQPASLAMLALGAQSLPLWRRKESVGGAYDDN